ncbi:MAG: efflux RND transporter permease subunit [Nannocystales bacterium]
MNAIMKMLGQSRLIMTAAGLLAAVGLFAWLTMPRQEDPDMTVRWALVSVEFAGADAEKVESLIIDPLEEHLAEVDELRRTFGTARAGFGSVQLVFRDSVDADALDDAWKDVEDALEAAQQEFPEGAGDAVLDRGIADQTSVVWAITGPGDSGTLHQAAQDIKDDLLSAPNVAKVELIADPGQQLTIELDDAAAHRYGLTPVFLRDQLYARNAGVPGGAVRVGDKMASLRPGTEFRSLQELRSTAIVLPTGVTVPLDEIADVRFGEADPRIDRVRHDGVPAVAVAVVPREGINLVDFGETMRETADGLRARYPQVQLEELIFQPERVEARIAGLGTSLLMGIGVVAVVLCVAMGVRMGLVVSAVIPLVAFAALALYAAAGGMLHQMSIAALVIALGMLVDNAIVVAEHVQGRIDEGIPPLRAAAGSVRELALPLGAATGTTMAAFVPMLLAEGGVGEFTRAIPILIMLTLGISYAYAVLVTPVLSNWLLRQRKAVRKESLLERVSGTVGRISIRRPLIVIALALGVVAASFGSIGMVEQRFFPASDRNQVLIDLKLPEGSHLDEIDSYAQALEANLSDQDNVHSVVAFVGRSAPHFYYNLSTIPRAPHFAQLVVNTTSKQENQALIEHVRAFAAEDMPQVQVVARGLEQGPGLPAPVELRLTGDDFGQLRQAAELVMGELRTIDGSVDVRDDGGLGVPNIEVDVDDAAAARHGVTRMDVAHALRGHTYGLNVGQYRGGEDPVPIMVRSPQGENTPVDGLPALEVGPDAASSVPLAQIAQTSVIWRPAAIYHYKGERKVSVLSGVEANFTSAAIVAELLKKLEGTTLPEGVTLEVGGENEGSNEANTALLQTLPLGVLMLIGFLMIEFNSFRRVGIVMTTVPLAAAGVIPGLILGGQPFGFMSLLGVIALVGIVVNNAIVMVDVVERRRHEGASLDEALVDAVRKRARPILLTTITTIAGLMPLALSATSLWPPLAWAMISGLAASTALTLIVVPALYKVLFRRSAAYVKQEAQAQ